MAKRMVRRAARALLAVTGCLVLSVAAVWVALASEYSGTPSPAARSTGNDAEWLGHAWVDGRKGQSDVDVLAAQLRETGIRDLFVHAGPFSDDGSLDPAIRPQAAWLTKALHTALPGVRVQAWLGAHLCPVSFTCTLKRLEPPFSLPWGRSSTTASTVSTTTSSRSTMETMN